MVRQENKGEKGGREREKALFTFPRNGDQDESPDWSDLYHWTIEMSSTMTNRQILSEMTLSVQYISHKYFTRAEQQSQTVTTHLGFEWIFLSSGILNLKQALCPPFLYLFTELYFDTR